MQISRHWRIKQQRYRLEGMRFQNGEVSLQARPLPQQEVERTQNTQRNDTRVPAAIGR